MSSFYEQLVEAIDFIPNPRVLVKAPIPWGQSPQLAHWEAPTDPGQPDWYGTLQPGDRVQLLIGLEPERGQAIRVQVFPHDGRQVGNSQNRVWIRWPGEAKAKRLLEIVEEAKE